MIATCPHVVRLTAVTSPRDVCETCIEVGGTWVHLRQCLACGRTGCCDSSPNKHASSHAHEAGHEVMRSLEEGEDWSWCFACQRTLRQAADGTWLEIDPFFEDGLWFARRLAAAAGSVEPRPGEMTPEGFPLGEWAATYRAKRRDGAIDPEQAEALEALPGWTW